MSTYDFSFTGAVYSDAESDCPCQDFSLSFLVQSPLLPQVVPFSTTLAAYDVDVTSGSAILEQNGTGMFHLGVLDRVTSGPGISSFDTNVTFTTSAVSWQGAPDTSLGYPDPLNGVTLSTELGTVACAIPGGLSGYCTVQGKSTSVPEPSVVGLLSMALLVVLTRALRSDRTRRIFTANRAA